MAWLTDMSNSIANVLWDDPVTEVKTETSSGPTHLYELPEGMQDVPKHKLTHYEVLQMKRKGGTIRPRPETQEGGSPMVEYHVYDVVFVRAPTKTEEEQGMGARILGPTVTVVATSEALAVANAAQHLDDPTEIESSLVHARVRKF